MGKRSALDIVAQKQIFEKHKRLITTTRYSSIIYNTIAKDINYVMSPKALYLSFRRNFLNNQNSPRAKDECFIKRNEDNTNSIIISSTSSSGSSPVIQQASLLHQISFKFPIDVHEWKKIEPLSYTYKRHDKNKPSARYQTYRAIPKFKWSGLLRKKLWEFYKLPCTVAFKRHVIQGANITFYGRCTQCQATVKIQNKDKTDHIIDFLCEIDQLQPNFKHNPLKKIRLTPYSRRTLSKKLKFDSATIVRKQIASHDMIFQDKEPPVLPSVGALRQIRHETRKQKWYHTNQILSVVIMANTSTYSSVIQEILMKPTFHIYYWLEEQIKYYKQYVQEYGRPTISLDATGSIIKPIVLPNGTKFTKRLFLYVILITADSFLKSIPISQMLSDSHTKNSIADWLGKWASNGIIPPAEIITDDSSALIAATIQCFTSYKSTKDYLEASYSALEGHTNSLPVVYMRIDTSHFVKTIHNLSCFNNTTENVKFFFVRCILYIKTAECIVVIREIIENMLTVILTKFNSKICFDAHCNLKRRIQGITIDKKDSNNAHNYVDEERFLNEENVLDVSNFMVWFDNIVACKNKQEEESCERPNKLYYPPLISTLKRLLGKLPMWSNVMAPLYNSKNKNPSSSASEDYFKTIKHLLLKTKVRKYRIDEFLNIHINHLNGELNIAASELQNNEAPPLQERKIKIKKNRQKRTHQKRLFPQDSIFSDMPSFVENWKGQAEEPVTVPIYKMLKFIKNGNIVTGSTLTNTCGFDAVTYLIAYGYIAFNNFKLEIDQTENNNNMLCNYIQFIGNKNISEAAVYELRNTICKKYYKLSSKNTIDINCECNVANLFEQMILELFYSALFTKICTEEKCAFQLQRTVPFLPINMNVIKTFGISALEDSICIDVISKDCEHDCPGTVLSSYNVKNIISFDLNGTDQIILNDIPLSIKVRTNIYVIVGAIEYVVLGENLGHYKCHLFNQDLWMCYDDLQSSVKKSNLDLIFLHSLTYILA